MFSSLSKPGQPLKSPAAADILTFPGRTFPPQYLGQVVADCRKSILSGMNTPQPIPSGPRASLLHNPRMMAGLLGLAVFLVFLPAVTFDFVNWDDNVYVYSNPLVLNGLSLRGVHAVFTRIVEVNWIPLTFVSYQLDATLFGPGPAGFHSTNIVLHSAATALLWIALARMTGCPGRSAAAMLLFAIHPLRVESVAWVSERKDVLSGFFLALSLYAYDRYCRDPVPRRYLLVAVAMLAGLLSKPILVTLPVLLLLLDAWPLHRISVPGVGCPARCDGTASPYPTLAFRKAIAEKLPLLVISLIFAAITMQSQAQAIQSEADMPFLEARLPNAVQAIVAYGQKTFWPTSLHVLYLHPGVATASGWLWLGYAASITGCIGLAAAAARVVPAVPIGCAWFLVSLLPVLGLVAQQGCQSYADRFTYVPHIGLSIAIVWGTVELARQLRFPHWVLPALLTAVASTFVILDQWQLFHWRDSISLWNHAIAIEPSSPTAHCHLGVALRDRGLHREAESHFRQALDADPGFLLAHNNLAAMLAARGNFAAARQQLEQAVRYPQRDAVTLTHLGTLFLAEGKAAEASEAARGALDLDSSYASAHYIQGKSLAEQGFVEPAIEAYTKALKLDPESGQIGNDLATLLARLKRFDEAIPLYRSIVNRDPTDEIARRNLAKAMQEQAHGARQERHSMP